jgi:hypothetical protein
MIVQVLHAGVDGRIGPWFRLIAGIREVDMTRKPASVSSLNAQAFQGAVPERPAQNDGPGLSADDRTLAGGAERRGVGLSNTRGRLVTLYGAESSIQLRNGDEAGVETIVKVPYRTAV